MVDVAELGIKVNSAPALTGAQNLDKLTASAIKADAAADKLATNTGKLGPAMAGAGQNSRMFAQQLSQVAQQGSATGNYVQALAIQLPDLAMGFGAAGIAAGVVASVALPGLMSALVSTGNEARSFNQALDAAEGNLSTLNELAKAYSGDGLVQLQEKYGEVNAELLLFINRMKEAEQAQALDAMREAISGLGDEFGAAFDALNGPAEDLDLVAQMIKDEFGLTVEQVRQLQTALEQASTADSFAEQAAAVAEVRELLAESSVKGGELYMQALQAEDAMRKLANSAPAAGWLSGMISEAQNLAGSLWDAVSAKFALADDPMAALGNDERGSQRDGRASAGAFKSQQAVRDRMRAAASTGGGGGGGSDQYAQQLAALTDSLQTEQDILDQWYEDSQALLADRRSLELLTEQQHKDALLGIEQEYLQQVAELQNDQAQTTLGHWSNLFGNMATIAKAGGDKATGVIKAFSIAQGLIQARAAYLQVLADPSLIGRPFLRTALAYSTMAAGLAQVAAMGGGGGGGARSAAAQGAQTAAAQSVEFMVKGLDRTKSYTGEELAMIFDGITEEAQKRGLQTAIRFV